MASGEARVGSRTLQQHRREPATRGRPGGPRRRLGDWRTPSDSVLRVNSGRQCFGRTGLSASLPCAAPPVSKVALRLHSIQFCLKSSVKVFFF